MKFTPQELSEIRIYLDALYPDMEMRFSEEYEDVLEFSKHALLMYKAEVDVGRADGKGGTTVAKEPVFFLQTVNKEVRKTPDIGEVIYSLIIFSLAEDLRMAFVEIEKGIASSHKNETVQ